MPSKNSSSMPALAEPEETKRKQGPRKEYFPFAMILDNGMQRNNVPNSSTCSMEKSMWVRTSACFQFPTGQSWMCGTTSVKSNWHFLPFIIRTKEPSLKEMDYTGLIPSF